jgi:hypothetical protein
VYSAYCIVGRPDLVRSAADFSARIPASKDTCCMFCCMSTKKVLHGSSFGVKCHPTGETAVTIGTEMTSISLKAYVPCVRHEALTAVCARITVLWDVTPRKSVERFRK